MKLATVKKDGVSFVICEDRTEKLLHLARANKEKYGEDHAFPSSMLAIIDGGKAEIERIKELQSYAEGKPHLFLDKEEVVFEAPIPRPRKNIFCVGKNYKDHAIEMGSEADIPEHIMLFTKAPTTVIGTGEAIPNHASVTEQLDYEGEVAVVIGKTAKGVKREAAEDYIFGYTIINDVTARDLQARHKQFFIGKSLDGSCPMGPYIVHKSSIQHPLKLQVQTKVNGELRQNGNTGQFIFSIPEMIETLSKGMTLEPGDIIATGTPAGVGKGFKPPRFLNSGDEIEITVEGLGTLANKVEF
ncbi:fumarylacetoacetate hydrolase family protein [Bacillus testis]|uniref:fumarylacetoacetate hydrolase family protein n=1 Tax=Bacillus testis TaxID=1622072 RepID=UPI00067F197B|nr:fumarylacetoacetate hydrolase family protein [Bacillus testis]